MGMSVSMRTPQKRSYSKFYMECEIEFDSLGLKYKECFNKSVTVVFEIEMAFV